MEKATKDIHLRVTPTQKQDILGILKRYKIDNKATLSSFIIEATKNYYQTETKERADTLTLIRHFQHLSQELNKLGTNVNQAIKKINSVNDPKVFWNELQKLTSYLSEIDKQRNEIKEVIEKSKQLL